MDGLQEVTEEFLLYEFLLSDELEPADLGLLAAGDVVQFLVVLAAVGLVLVCEGLGARLLLLVAHSLDKDEHLDSSVAHHEEKLGECTSTAH